MRLLILIAGALLVSGFGAWLINPGWIIPTLTDTSAYAEQKSGSEKNGHAALTARSLSIEDAYRRVPHNRTPFRPDLARMSDLEARYLHALFDLTDRGVVERVVNQEQLYWGSGLAMQSSNYDALLSQLMSLPTPEGIMPAEALIFEAIREQQQYLADWRESENPRYFSPQAALVQSSHKKLITAYGMLIKRYSDESRHNKQAFFDHLCALDFI